jgi:hypothetical protein
VRLDGRTDSMTTLAADSTMTDPSPESPRPKSNDHSRFLNMVQTIAIVAGLLYGAVQLTQFRSEQRRQSKIELARSFMTMEFMDAVAFVTELPDSATNAVVKSYPQATAKIFLLSQTFETVGILVHQGDLDLALVDDFLGTLIISSWTKLHPLFDEYRVLYSSRSVGEWFQWLAERLTEYRATSAPAPAHEAYRNWKPR